MGVRFHQCDFCERTFSDCEEGYTYCHECGKKFCSTLCALPQRSDQHDEIESCRICREEYITDETLLIFLLKRSNLTKASATELYKKEKSNGR